MILYHAPWVLPVASPAIRDGGVLVDDGRIRRVGPAHDLTTSLPPGTPIRGFENSILLPGLVNNHCHLEYTVWKDLLDRRPYLDWIRTLVRSKLETVDNEDLLDSARLGAWQAMRSGATTLGEQTARDVSVRALEESRLGGVVYLEAFGKSRAEGQEALERLPERIDAAIEGISGRCQIGLTPHTPWTSGPELISGVARLARERDLLLAIHAAESREEVEFCQSGRGAIAQLWRAERLDLPEGGRSPVGYLDRLGFWEGGSRVQAVHLVLASASDWKLLSTRGSGIALCPRSNQRLQVGGSPIGAGLDSGLAVGLGTDSRASSPSLSPLDEARFAWEMTRRAGKEVAPEKLLGWITLEAARSLCLEHDVGSLEPGKAANLAAFPFPSQVPEDPVLALLEAPGPALPSAVVLEGELVCNHGKPTSSCPLDPERLEARGIEIHQRLSAKIRGIA